MFYKHNSERLITSPSVFICFKHEDPGAYTSDVNFPKPHLVSTGAGVWTHHHITPEPRGIMERGGLWDQLDMDLEEGFLHCNMWADAPRKMKDPTCKEAASLGCFQQGG